jgi:hypothetical protein
MTSPFAQPWSVVQLLFRGLAGMNGEPPRYGVSRPGGSKRARRGNRARLRGLLCRYG